MFTITSYLDGRWASLNTSQQSLMHRGENINIYICNADSLGLCKREYQTRETETNMPCSTKFYVKDTEILAYLKKKNKIIQFQNGVRIKKKMK